MQRFKKLAKGLLFIYVLITIMLYFLQEKLIFLPTRLPNDFEYSFTHDFEEINLKTEDGYNLNAIHFKQVKSKGLILYFHGNAGNLSRWGDITSFFVEKDFDVLVMDYRTYGKSTGKLSEEALHDDAQLFYDYAMKQYDEDEIILYGRSLGTGIAANLASKNKPNKLILETPYYSLMDVARERFPYLPVKWLMKYKFLSHVFMQNVTCPITIFHGTNDRVVPYTSGKRLFNSLPHKTIKFYTIDQGEHNNLIKFETYLEGIEEVLQ
ncbi:MAG: alpha/beta fold hydrolase [Maribacter sp.]|nr:alpha/beta fold hydrolase [Maribacter sp.]